MYQYTVENLQNKEGNPVKVTTIYPLSVGMYTQVLTDRKDVVKVVEIIMYDNEAVIIVETLKEKGNG